MIKINGEVVNTKKFPDGTLLFKEDVSYDFKNYREATITWLPIVYLPQNQKSHPHEYLQ